MKFDIFFLKDKPEFIDICSKYIYHEFKAFYHLLGFYSYNQLSRELSNKYLNTSKLPITIIAISKNNYFLGCATIEDNDMDIRVNLSPWISDLYVVPFCRNQGVGQSLIKFLFQILKKLNIKKIYLWTQDKQIYFRNIGFSDFENEKVKYLNHWVKIMSYDLI